MEKLRVIIIGSTGMVGKGALLECIDSPDVESILLINRNPIDVKHSKVKEIILKDLFNVASVRENLIGFNACFFCLGVTSVGTNEVDYIRIMYELPMLIAKELKAQNPDMTFCFVSGAGTDSSENGKVMWARVKGKAENDLIKLGFKKAYMFRPGLIISRRGIKSRTRLYNILYVFFKPFTFLLKRIPSVTDTVIMGKAMINAALVGYPLTILESVDINQLGKA